MAAKKKPSGPTAYTSPEAVYTAGQYHNPGDVFVTDADPNDNWTPVDDKQRAAIDAATQEVPADATLDNLDLSALLALAATKNVPTVGIEKDKAALLTAIRAAQEPAL
jgi:hypothetical protein